MSSDPKTDLANAERFIADWKDFVRFEYRDATHGSWLIWDEMRWKRDETEEVMRLGAQTATKLGYEAVRSGDDRLARWAIQSQRIERMRAMLAIARTLEGIGVPARNFDNDPFLFNCRNGTLDLKTGALRDWNQDDLITKLASVEYIRDAECPMWNSFLETALPDLDVRDFVQRGAGYSLTGDVREECLMFLWGPGNNGKTTFTKPLGVMMGDYYWEASPEVLMIEREASHREDIANLRGVRFATVNETKRGRMMNETRAKQLAGKDRINARHLYEREFQFEPSHKLWVRTNHKPRIDGTDNGIWRRIRLVPFTITIPSNQIIKDLDQRIIEQELPGVLAWAVRGCRRWLDEGLPVPLEVEAATSNWRSESDMLADFIGSYLQRVEGAIAAKNDVYQAYRQWCGVEGNTGPMNMRELTGSLRDSGFEDGRGTSNVAIWKNVQLKGKAIWQTTI